MKKFEIKGEPGYHEIGYKNAMKLLFKSNFKSMKSTTDGIVLNTGAILTKKNKKWVIKSYAYNDKDYTDLGLV